MKPLWNPPLVPRPASAHEVGPAVPPIDAEADVVVVGAGITGLAVAVEAAEAGLGVVVLEDRHLGAGATGLSTAKVTVLHGTRYSMLARRHSPEVARRYGNAQRAGLAWLLDRAAPELERATAFTYAADPSDLATVHAEVGAATAAGIDARFVERPDVPFPAVGAVAVDDQAQVDPFRLLDRLRQRLVEHGGRLVEGCRVVGVDDGRNGAVVRTVGDGPVVRAGWVVVATGLPFLDRALLFARTEPKTSYCMGVRMPDPLPDGMFLSAGSASTSVRSVRTAADPERPGERVLVVGGAGHKTGAIASTADRYAELLAWTERHWSVESVPWRWSTEDFVPDDGLPFVGPASPFSRRVLVATGYAKWGFTTAAAAAPTLVAHITGGAPPGWAADWDPRRFELRRGGRALLRANADVAAKLVGGWAGRLVRGDVPRPTVRSPGRTDADVDADGDAVSAVCTHLGGIVRWNDGDGCWDCPLHGSKFATDGTLLHGPATKDLARRAPVSRKAQAASAVVSPR